MAISFPINLPQEPSVASVKWIQDQLVYVQESPFTFEGRQVQTFDGQRFKIEITVDPMTREEYAAWSAAIGSLRGPRGSFLFGDILNAQQLGAGAGAGTPRIKGPNQIGETLITDGWPNNTTVLKANDFIQISGTYKIHQVQTDAITNGSGEVTLDIYPRAKSYPDNSVIIYSGWKGLFALDDPTQEIIPARYNRLAGFSFTAVGI